MAKKQDKTTVKLTVGISKVAHAIAKAYETQASSGDIVTQVCKIAASVFKGRVPSTLDLKEIASMVAKQRGWTPASAGPRMSEVRKIVRNYLRIPEAITAYMRKNDTFSWHTAMRLITCLNSEPSTAIAVKKMEKGNTAKAAARPGKVIALAVSRIMNVETRAAKTVAFQTGLEALCTKHDIVW